VADTGNHCLRGVALATGAVAALAGTCGTAGAADGAAPLFYLPRALAFAAACGKPWAMLLPEFCARKAYFAPALGLPGPAAPPPPPPPPPPGSDAPPRVSPACGPLYFMGPASAAYMFSAPGRGLAGTPVPPAAPGPAAAAAAAAAPPPPPPPPRVAHVFAATFQCVWFLALGAAHAEPLLKWWRKRVAPAAACRVAADERALPQLALDPGRKRRDEGAAKRPWRKQLSRSRKKAAAAGV